MGAKRWGPDFLAPIFCPLSDSSPSLCASGQAHAGAAKRRTCLARCLTRRSRTNGAQHTSPGRRRALR